MFDVILSNAGPDVLAAYPVLLLVGDHEFDAQFITRLFDALRASTRLLVHERHEKQLGDDFKRLQGTGQVDVLEPWKNSATNRPAALSNARLAHLCDTLLPVRVEGDPVQYQVNRTPSGWIIELINNEGVVKRPTEPAIVEKNKIAHVTLTPRVPVASASLLRSGEKLDLIPSISLSIPPGETRFVVLR